MNFNELVKAKGITVGFIDVNGIDGHFVKEFREKNGLTQFALATIMGVKKKTVEKWEQGKNPIIGSSSILFRLLDNDPCLIERIYSVSGHI